MRKILFSLGFIFFITSCYVLEAQQDDYVRFTEGFKDPPLSARPKAYWWCLNGNIDTLRAKQEFLAMKNAGLSGFDIFEIGVPKADTMIPGGPAFLSDESLKILKTVIDEAGRLGLTVGLNLASSWNAGGSWVKPEHAGKSLYFSKVSLKGVQGYLETKLPFPDISFPKASLIGGTGKPMIPFRENGRPAYYDEIAVLAVPSGVETGSLDSLSVLDLTKYFDYDNDILKWEVPSGEWDIFRYICSNSGQELVLPSPKSAGLTIDHFDSVAVETHLMYIINRLLPVIGDFKNTALKSLYLASYEARGFVWTSSLKDEFRRLNGYDITKFIPALFAPELFKSEISEKTRSDFRRTLSELMINNLYEQAKEISNKYGLAINCEAGGPGYPLYNGPAEPLKALGSLDIPRGEFWVNHSRYYMDDNGKDSIDILRVVKEVAAASHIYNRGIVEEESFTSFQHWMEGPGDIKPFGDRAFCEGMNKVVLHGFSHNISGSGYPGYVYHAGTHFNTKRVWWPMVKPFFDYLSRASFIFQKTNFVADVVWYYGDKIPNSATPKNTHFRVGPGYDYEVINTEILVNNLSVKDGRLYLPNGSSFSLLAIEKEKVRSPSVEQKLKKLSAEGAVITGTEPEELLKYLNVKPDFVYRDDDSSLLDYIHYRKGDLDFYFIRNTSEEWISRLCGFRQKGKVPELWDPVTGEIVPVRIYDTEDTYTNLPLTLPPFGSCFIVFRHTIPTQTYTNIRMDTKDTPYLQYLNDGVVVVTPGAYRQMNDPRPRKVITRSIMKLEGQWKVSFPLGFGAPLNYVMENLASLTEIPIPGISYFSGVATYEKPFSFRFGKEPMNDKKIYLDLGTVEKVAEVWLNNKFLGTTWTMPHRFDITGLIIHGENYLTVKVANTWSNRIIGDAVLGEKYTNTNITRTSIPGTGSTNVPWAEVPLLESGLLGPVTIETVNILH
ncbi:MAG TPA: glycosyl hydrolase [Bacteroidales bacterium]|nr:glycosyl hydrolase [Bacteroidales bacterium]